MAEDQDESPPALAVLEELRQVLAVQCITEADLGLTFFFLRRKRKNHPRLSLSRRSLLM
jgi:hypothetical protein